MRSENTDYPGDVFNVRELLEAVWNAKLLIVSVTIVTTLSAGVAAWLAPERFEASVLVSPVTDSSGGQLGGGSLTSQLGGLASLAGLSVSGDSTKSESVAVLQSDALTQRYIQEKELLTVIYAKEWNPELKQWQQTDPEEVPTLWKAAEYFKGRIRTVTTDSKTGLVKLTIRWTDPKLAATWANDLVSLANEYLRGKAITESERNMAYLNSEAEKTNIVGARQAIFAILQSEINKTMLARGNDEYAFKVIDPAIEPERPSSPQTLLWLIVGLFGGLVLSTFVVFTRLAWKRVPRP
jgi:uncharacterized protein involved in exopolysaccharide biosynthesis